MDPSHNLSSTNLYHSESQRYILADYRDQEVDVYIMHSTRKNIIKSSFSLYQEKTSNFVKHTVVPSRSKVNFAHRDLIFLSGRTLSYFMASCTLFNTALLSSRVALSVISWRLALSSILRSSFRFAPSCPWSAKNSDFFCCFFHARREILAIFVLFYFSPHLWIKILNKYWYDKLFLKYTTSN